jgi:CheY-like chemotaxis protein
MTRNIIAVVDDIFFASKIRGTAEQVGVAVAFARSADGVSEIIQQQAPSLIICDLHSQKINPIDLAKSPQGKGGNEKHSSSLASFLTCRQSFSAKHK